MHRILRLSLICSLLAGFATAAFAQVDTLTIATYSLLGFSTSSSNLPARLPYFRTVIGYMAPDLIGVDELSPGGGELFRDTVLNNAFPGQYAMATYYDGPDSDPGLFYRTAKFTFDSARFLSTDLRVIGEYFMHTVNSNVPFRVYEAHLKASTGTSNQNSRNAEAQVLRTQLNSYPSGGKFVVMGDFNLYRAAEPAYVTLLDSSVNHQGRCVDPLAPGSLTLGNWDGTAAYSYLHTQSTRSRQLSDGGATGGCDSRFDFILISEAMRDTSGLHYLTGSYKSVGQDGNHLNDSINMQPNTAVPVNVANALYYASDHMPVSIKAVVGSIPSVPPNAPVVTITQIDAANARLSWPTVPTATGYRVYSNDTYNYLFPGSFNLLWSGPDTTLNVTMPSGVNRVYQVTATN